MANFAKHNLKQVSIMLIDSHAHIYLSDFKEDQEAIINRAVEAGVKKILMPNIDSTTIEDMLYLAEKFPDICYPMMGLHPGSVKGDFEKELYIIEEWLNKRPFIAVGEIGTDLYWDNTYIEQQKEAMRIQMQWAKKFELPIVIHSRDSFDLTFQLVFEEKNENLKGVFHCFTGSVDDIKKIKSLNFFIGIGGVLTFKNSGLDKTLEKVNLENLILETDSPFLTPTPHRGKRNEPSYTKLIAEKLASITNEELDTISETTSNNTHKLFKLD